MFTAKSASVLGNVGSGEENAKPRSLAYEDLFSFLSDSLPEKGGKVIQGNLHRSLLSIFSSDAPEKSKLKHVRFPA